MRPSIVTGFAISHEKPRRAPNSRNAATSPARSRPNWKSSPTQTSRTSPASATRVANSSGESAANFGVKRSTATVPAPARSRSARRSAMSESAEGGAPGASTSIGSGSNVHATTEPPARVARSARAPMSVWWPIWTPSKTPIATYSGPPGQPAKSWTTVTLEGYGAQSIAAAAGSATRDSAAIAGSGAALTMTGCAGAGAIARRRTRRTIARDSRRRNGTGVATARMYPR